MKKQAGFTIIELVVVIALLGILAAVALPRFIDVTEDANNAAVQGAAGGFAAGVALVRAQAVVDNAASGALVDLDANNSVVVNGTGYPVGVSGASQTLTDGQCVDVWNSVLQGSRPVASTADSATTAGVDYDAAASAGTDCVFTYRTQNNGVDRTITYESDTGNVTAAGVN